MFTNENNYYWKKFSDEINADFMERKYWHSAKCFYDYKGFKIIFDNYTHHAISGRNSIDSYLTRIYVLFNCDKILHLKLQERSILNVMINIFNSKKIKLNNQLLDDRFIISSKEKRSLIILSKTVEKLIESNIKYLFVDDNEGIWGDKLNVNQFELATYIDNYKVDYSNLYKIKELFEILIDNLISDYNIKSLK